MENLFWAHLHEVDQEQPDALNVLESVEILSECELLDAQEMKQELLALVPAGLKPIEGTRMKCEDVLAVFVANCRCVLGTNEASKTQDLGGLPGAQVLSDIKVPLTFAEMIWGELMRFFPACPSRPSIEGISTRLPEKGSREVK